MLRGDLQLSPSPIYDPLSGNPDGTGRTQFQVFPGDPNYALCNTATNPGCLNIIPAARMDPIAQQIASHFPANNLDREGDNYFVSAPFKFDRHQVDSKVDFNVNPKFNLAGTFGVLHYRTSVPTVFGDDAVGEPIGGSSNPGSGHGNTYRFTVMGTYIFTPTFLMDAHFGWASRGRTRNSRASARTSAAMCSAFPGRTARAPSRAAGRRSSSPRDDDFATIGVNENFMPYYRHDPQTQYVVNFNWIKNKHNVRFGADIYHMALNQAQAEFITGGFGAQGGFGFDRGITERCEARRSGDGQLRADVGRVPLQQRGGVPDRAGQPRRQNAAGAGRIPRAGTAVQPLCPRSLDHRQQSDPRLRHAVGVLPGSDTTRSGNRTLRRRDQQGVALRRRLRAEELRHRVEQDALRSACGAGVSVRARNGWPAPVTG